MSDTGRWNVVFGALQRTEAGRILNRDVTMRMADDVCAALGLPGIGEGEPAEYTGPDASLQNAIAAVLDFMPDGGYEVPLFSEAVLYPLLGKDSARTLLMRLRAVASAAGVKWR